MDQTDNIFQLSNDQSNIKKTGVTYLNQMIL